MKKTALTVFTESDLSELLSSLDIETDKVGLKEYILDSAGERATCECCGSEIYKENVGNIMRGSKHFYCKNPACFANYLIKTKL